MSEVATVTLTSTGALGYNTSPLMKSQAFAVIPKTVKLGRIKPKARPQALKLLDYIGTIGIGTLLRCDYTEKAMPALGRMYLNDQYGDCVIAGKYHNIGVWSGNDGDSGGIITVDDSTVSTMYQKLKAGPGDSGCVISDVLNYLRDHGFPVGGGAVHKIDGYMSVDWRDEDLLKAAIYLFGAVTIGIDLPEAWTNSDVWDVTNSQIVGGHDVSLVGFNEKGVLVSSWGRIYLMTWGAVTSTRWLSEAYVLLAPLWYGNDKLAANGFSVEQLKADLADIGGGHLPPINPEPSPVPPTPPVVPPAPVVMHGYAEGPVTFHVPLFGTITAHAKLPVTVSSEAAGRRLIFDRIPWLAVVADIRKLVADVKPVVEEINNLAGMLSAPVEDVMQLLRDFGIPV